MSLRNQIPTKVSARSVYSKQSTVKETPEKRGRPKKFPVSEVAKNLTPSTQDSAKRGRGRPRKNPKSPLKVKSNLRKKNSPKIRKRKSSVTFKNTAEIIENNSSEADLSSEGEETDPSIHNGHIDDVQLKNNEVENSGDENEEKNEENVESSGEEGDIEEGIGEQEVINDEEENGGGTNEENDDVANEENDSDENDSDKRGKRLLVKQVKSKTKSKHNKNIEEHVIDVSEEEQVSADEIQEQIDSDDDASDNFPDFGQLTSNIKTASAQKHNSKKRKIRHENGEEGERNGISPFRSKKKKKRMERAYSSMQEGVRSISTLGNSRIASCNSQRDNLHSPSTSFFPTLNPAPLFHDIDSLIRLNKLVPCGNAAADQAFRWLISPTLPEDFFNNMFEKSPFVVTREHHQYYKDLFTGNDLNTMLKEHHLEYGVHLDVVKYVKGMRIPVSADGRAYYSNVWEDYKQGYSLRVRNPQTYNKKLWQLCSLLQEYFSSSVGCNIYLTPPKAQGFPPHYDDIDAFIVQVEGRKYWKIYSPRYPEEELARYSSKDFAPDEIGSPMLQVCLNAGEMLYIPRGYIHQAATDGVTHSLHLTFSTNQLNTWGDLLLIAASRAVEKAMLSDVTFRESISKDYMDYIGSAVANSKAFKRYELVNKVKDLAKKAMSFIDVDEAADQHSLKFIETSLPPIFNKIEKAHSLHGNGSYWKNGEIRVKGLIQEDTEIQLIKKRNLRLVIGDNNPRLYHSFENLRDPKPATDEDSMAAYIEFEMEAVPSYLFLRSKFPDFVKVRDIPLDDPDDKISFATSLYENGLIMTKEPLPRVNDDLDWSSIPDIIPLVKKEERS